MKFAYMYDKWHKKEVIVLDYDYNVNYDDDKAFIIIYADNNNLVETETKNKYLTEV